MIATAVPGEVATWWGWTLGIGFVVTLVVVALLHSILKVVRGIETELIEVWHEGKLLASNTSMAMNLGEAAHALESVAPPETAAGAGA